ncbi:hypothetical protein GQ600_14333 [Phytophthora cactorum]|nr:hypothetical protein GQ600_14333 [Phytophthora cactorum]
MCVCCNNCDVDISKSAMRKYARTSSRMAAAALMVKTGMRANMLSHLAIFYILTRIVVLTRADPAARGHSVPTLRVKKRWQEVQEESAVDRGGHPERQQRRGRRRARNVRVQHGSQRISLRYCRHHGRRRRGHGHSGATRYRHNDRWYTRRYHRVRVVLDAIQGWREAPPDRRITATSMLYQTHMSIRSTTDGSLSLGWIPAASIQATLR